MQCTHHQTKCRIFLCTFFCQSSTCTCIPCARPLVIHNSCAITAPVIRSYSGGARSDHPSLSMAQFFGEKPSNFLPLSLPFLCLSHLRYHLKMSPQQFDSNGGDAVLVSTGSRKLALDNQWIIETWGGLDHWIWFKSMIYMIFLEFFCYVVSCVLGDVKQGSGIGI